MRSLSGYLIPLKFHKEKEKEPSPDALRELLRRVRRIEIATKRAVNEVFAGQYHSVFKGRGIEFLEVRQYYPGDEIRSIDWNVTARFGAPFVKVFAEERELTVMIMVDASSSLGFGTVDKTKAELCAELSGLIAFSAIKNNDRVGLIIFTDRIEKYLKPKKGAKNGLRVIREVLGFKPERKTTDLALALDFLFRVQRRKAVAFLISDFLAKGYEQKLKSAKKRYDLIAVRLSDPREKEIPALGLIELEDIESGEKLLVDSSEQMVREYFTRFFQEKRLAEEQIFKKAELDSMDIYTGENYEPTLIQFFRARAKRASR